jgi:ATP-dependent Clp protease ATP-binding subunit ClpC
VFERFTERARRVIILAREEAGRFRHDFVGTEHILLGLIRDGEGIATAVLQRLGLRLETVKAEVERALAGFPKTLTFGEVPFTPQAKRVLHVFCTGAVSHNYIGTEHLLLGLMKEGQSIAANPPVSRRSPRRSGRKRSPSSVTSTTPGPRSAPRPLCSTNSPAT